MTDTTINACSACTLRHGINNINELNECCYNTCASFVDGNQSDIINSECGRSCYKCMANAVGCKGKSTCAFLPKVPSIKIQQQRFKACLEAHDHKPDEALKCCLSQCSNFNEQEQCIDAFNAMISVKENFLYRGGLLHRSFLFLIAVIGIQLYQIFQQPMRQLRDYQPILIIVIMYYSIHYLL